MTKITETVIFTASSSYTQSNQPASSDSTYEVSNRLISTSYQQELTKITETVKFAASSSYEASNRFFGAEIYDITDLTYWDFEESYFLCKTALTDYYLTIWNNEQIDFIKYIDNANLLQYLDQKTHYTKNLVNAYMPSKSTIDIISIGMVQMEYMNNSKDCFCFKFVIGMKKQQAFITETTELLVAKSKNGNLVVADWYSGESDGYDSKIRGEYQQINNPEIWDNSGFLARINKNQMLLAVDEY